MDLATLSMVKDRNSGGNTSGGGGSETGLRCYRAEFVYDGDIRLLTPVEELLEAVQSGSLIVVRLETESLYGESIAVASVDNDDNVVLSGGLVQPNWYTGELSAGGYGITIEPNGSIIDWRIIEKQIQLTAVNDGSGGIMLSIKDNGNFENN